MMTQHSALSTQDFRIGLIVPSSNTVVEPDFARYVPQAVRDLASLYPHVVAFACTSGGAVLGADGEAKLVGDIARETGALVVSTNEAVKSRLERCNPERIAVITPYVDELNQRIRAGLAWRGLNVVHCSGMGLTE